MTTSSEANEGQLWEVFVQEKNAAPHEHAGSVRAFDPETALQNARDVFARRGSLKSIWVVPARHVTATTPGDEGPFFESAKDKIYRHPQFYKTPRGVRE